MSDSRVLGWILDAVLGSEYTMRTRFQAGHSLVWKLFLEFILALVSRTRLYCSRAQVLGLCVLRETGECVEVGALQIMAYLPWKQRSCEDCIKREDRKL